jgi:putative oxidoreductase
MITAWKRGRTIMSMVSRSSHPALSLSDSVAMSTSDFVLLVARVLLGWIFVRSGYGKVMDMGAFAATFPNRGLPTFLAYIAAPFEFFGGICILLGLATRYVAAIFVVFMLVATFSSHAYWTFTDAAQRRIQDVNFYKNISMLGGILYLFVTGPGRLSVDNWLSKR